MVRGIQRSLLIADVNVELVKKISDDIKNRAEEVRPPPGISRKEQIVKIVYEELVSLLGGSAKRFLVKKKPHVIMMVGIQGSGKTTSVAKLANYLAKSGHKVGVVCADTYRPAAYQQLVQLLHGRGVKVYGEPGSGDAISITKRGIDSLSRSGAEVIIVDTAGRHREQDALMREMAELGMGIKPDEVALVIDATMGQQAGKQAEEFHRVVPVGWIMLTKLDTSARGGGALSAVASTGAPIMFVGRGEKIEDIEAFDPQSYVARLLGMPDLKGIIERVRLAETQISREDARAILSGQFTLQDMVKQLREMRKTGPLGTLLKMLPIPGVKSLSDEQLEKLEEQSRRWEAIINSMTEEEKMSPNIVNSSRARRIARGAGVAERDVKQLIRQYFEARRMMKNIKRARHRLPSEFFQQR